MSVQISHDCYSGSCGSFNDLRRIIAKAGGMDFDATEEAEWCNYLGMWKAPPADALTVFLVHSDCDGYIFPFDAGRIANRLEELLPLLEAGGDWHPNADWTPRSQTLQFIAGLREAADKNEVVVFS